MDGETKSCGSRSRQIKEVGVRIMRDVAAELHSSPEAAAEDLDNLLE